MKPKRLLRPDAGRAVVGPTTQVWDQTIYEKTTLMFPEGAGRHRRHQRHQRHWKVLKGTKTLKLKFGHETSKNGAAEKSSFPRLAQKLFQLRATKLRQRFNGFTCFLLVRVH